MPVPPQLVGTFVLAMFCGVVVAPVAAVVMLPADSDPRFAAAVSRSAADAAFRLALSGCCGWYLPSSDRFDMLVWSAGLDGGVKPGFAVASVLVPSTSALACAGVLPETLLEGARHILL